MPYYFDNTNPIIEGSDQNDIIWDKRDKDTYDRLSNDPEAQKLVGKDTTKSTIYGLDGDDVMYGDSTSYQDEGSDKFSNSTNLPIRTIWTTFENPDVPHLIDPATGMQAPHAEIRVPSVDSNYDYNYYRFSVVAGQKIVIDVDYGEYFTGSPSQTSSDIKLWLYKDSDADTNLLRTIDNITPPDARGSILGPQGDNGDPTLEYTFTSDGTYYLRVGETDPSRFDGGEQYLIYAALTGQNENGTDKIRVNHDLMYGGDGDDTMYGQGGNDTLNGGKDKDYVDGGTGNDTLNGNEDMDTLMGDKGRDLLYGGGGNDMAAGGDGRDNLKGGVGSDWLFGGEGIDNLKGDSGNPASARAGDFLFGGDGGTSKTNADKLDGNEGSDIIYGDGISDMDLAKSLTRKELEEGKGNDTKAGGVDIMTGGGGDDFIFGGGGSYDRLNGGNGSDTMTGGSGKDGFRFVNQGSIDHYRSGDHDRITDFKVGEDVLELKGNLPRLGDLSFSNQNGDLRIDFKNGYRLTLDDLGQFARTINENLDRFEQFYDDF